MLLLIIDLGNRRGEWSASRPGRALPSGKDPGTHWIGGWVDLRAGLDTETTGPCRGLNPGFLITQCLNQITAALTGVATP
jgi:hypothetical protein